MPFSQVRIIPINTVSRHLATGNTSSAPTGFYASDLQTNLRNGVRRAKPVDLFASGTTYSWYIRHCDDKSYRRPPNTLPGFEVWTACQVDANINAWAAFTPNYAGVESRLRAKIKDMNVNLAQSVAEYRQASKMFAGLAGDIYSTFRSFRFGWKFADFVRILQRPKSKQELAIANRWLQYQYGLKPLMNDLYGVSDALAKGIRDGMYLHVRSGVGDGFSSDVKTSDQNRLVTRVNARINGVARYKISDPTMKQVSQFGITNPLLLAWELIPYSFVVDWLFPVGRFLSSLDALNGISDLRVQTSCWEEHSIFFFGKYGGSAEFHGTRYNRNGVQGSLALPKLSYEPSDSLKAVANGLALLTQLRRR